jgi:hypothetical protein
MIFRLLSRARRVPHKVGVVRVDVRDLDRDQALDVFRRGTEPFAEEVRDDFDELSVQPGITLQFLCGRSFGKEVSQRT